MKVTISGFIHYRKESWMDEPEYNFFPFDMSDNGHVLIQPHSFEFEVPDNFDPRPQQIAALEAEKQKLRAEFAKRVTDIERQIAELQAIEFVDVKESA